MGVMRRWASVAVRRCQSATRRRVRSRSASVSARAARSRAWRRTRSWKRSASGPTSSSMLASTSSSSRLFRPVQGLRTGRGGRPDVELGQGQQPEGPVHPGGLRSQHRVRRVQGLAHGRLPFDFQRGQPADVGCERVGQCGDRLSGAGGEPGGGETHREGQTRAEVHDLADGGQFPGDRALADTPQEQLHPGGGAHRPQPVELRSVQPQSGQPVPAGHDDEAAGPARQQRPDLCRGEGVVQHHRDAQVRGDGPPQGRLFRQVDGDRPGAERTQEPAEDLTRVRRSGRRVPPQIGVQLSVGDG